MDWQATRNRIPYGRRTWRPYSIVRPVTGVTVKALREREMFGRTVTAAYPGMRVEIIRMTGQVVMQRHTPHCDVQVAPASDEPAFNKRTVVAPTVDDIRAGVPTLIDRWQDTFGS